MSNNSTTQWPDSAIFLMWPQIEGHAKGHTKDDIGRMRSAYSSSMLVSRVCLQEQRKQSFLTLAKENQSPLGLYRNPLTFFFINPRFVLLIRDRHFVLLSLNRNEITIAIRQKLRLSCASCQWSMVLWSVVNLHPKARGPSRVETPNTLSRRNPGNPYSCSWINRRFNCFHWFNVTNKHTTTTIYGLSEFVLL